MLQAAPTSGAALYQREEMMDNIIGLQDYPVGSPIHGLMGAGELATLHKALTTGQGIVAEGATGGQTFRVQSLERTLKVATEASERELVLWPRLKKDPAMSTTIEYTRLEDWGDSGDFAHLFDSEIAAVRETDATYKRLVELVKYLVVKKEVSFPATLVQNIVDPMAQKAHEGTMQILRAAEFAFAYGDASVNELEFNGFLKQIEDAAQSVPEISLDWEGNPPTEDMLEEASRIVADHFGYLDFMVMSTRAVRDLTRTLFPKQRITQPPSPDGRYGSPLQSWAASNSVIEIKGSRYIRNFRPRSEGMTGAPTAPAQGSLSATAADDSTSKLELNTTYYYWVSNSVTGLESAGTAVSATTSAVTPQKITISLADAGFGTGATYMTIYRSKTNDITTATRIARVKRVGGGSATTYVDRNYVRDNCTDAIGFTWTPEVLSLKQLAPLMKMDIAQTTTSLRFLILLYITPVLFVPTKCIRIRNIGLLPLDEEAK